MPRYLSPEWLAAADAAAASDASLRSATAGASVVVQHVVKDGPSGDVSFHVTVSDGSVRVATGSAPAPTVTFEQSYATAAEIGRGELSAQGAFLTGRLRVRGDLPQLVAQQAAFAGVDSLFGDLRASTDY